MRCGFSLIQLMIALAALAIVSCLALVEVQSLDRMIMKSELSLLASTCYYAAHIAALTGEDQEVQFYPDTHSYSYQNVVRQLPTTIGFGVLDRVNGPPSAPTKILTHPITFANNRLIISPSGIMQAGCVYLSDKKKQLLYALSFPVSQVSFLRIYRYDGKWCLLN